MNVVTELLKSSLKLKPKIISLAKCPLENSDRMEIKEFTCYTSTEAEKYGCAIYVNNEYVNMFVIDSITFDFVTLNTAGTEMTIGYKKPTAKTWDGQNKWHKGTKNIIIGNLNAISNTWSAGQSKTQGNILREWLDKWPNLEVVNRYDITYAPTNQNHSSSTINLVIANPRCKVKVKHRIIASTEHRALEVKTNLVWRETTEKLLRFNKADWGKIEAELTLLDVNDSDPIHLQENLTRIILAHTPRATRKA